MRRSCSRGESGWRRTKRPCAKLLRPLYPGFWFRRAALRELDELDVGSLRFPLVLKPAVGFFSVGVATVPSAAAWPAAVAAVRRQFDQWRGVYPRSVLDEGVMLLEQFVEGQEYAVDVYWDGEGRPVIVNLMAHLFRDAEDTTDRVYWTDAEVLRAELAPLGRTLGEIGAQLGFSDFPAHVELRVVPGGRAIPIEINPLRFAGFGTTDLAWYAFGSNSHDAFLRESVPDWDALLRGREGRVYSLVLCSLPPSTDRSRIVDVRWDELAASFEGLVALRPIDYRRYPILAFAFLESDSLDEPRLHLDTDFTQFLRMAPDPALPMRTPGE